MIYWIYYSNKFFEKNRRLMIYIIIEYLKNLKNDFREKLIIYLNSIYANVYRYAISIPIGPLLVEINQRKVRNFKSHIS